MKKTFVISMIIVLCLACVACDNSGQSAEIGDSNTKSSEESKQHVIAENATSVDSNIIVLNGVEYEMPVRMSELFEAGWTDEQARYKMDFDVSYSGNGEILYTTDYRLHAEDGSVLVISQVYNDTGKKTSVKDCLVTGLGVETNEGDIKLPKNFIFPGGITEKTTQEELISIYGSPEDTKYFTGESEVTGVFSMAPSTYSAANVMYVYDERKTDGANLYFYFDQNSEQFIGAQFIYKGDLK